MIGATYSMAHYQLYEEIKDKNLFEEIIDQVIIDDIPGIDDSFRQKISSLDRERKRMAILSLLDKDRNLFLKIKALFDKNINRFEHIKDVILMLREYVKVGDVEKKKYGEVMTPLELIKEMLATLPEEVWSNPNLKWLDPANGTGPYPIMVIYKLMVGLKDWEPDDEKRYKHIVENMIHVCELQPKNMFLYMCTVDTFDAYKLNIYSGSYLEEGFDYHMKNVWGIENFDIILGNPPYNGAETGGGNSLWDKFIRKSIPLIVENGHLVFVHPASWRKPPSERSKTKDIWKLLTKENQLLYLEIHSTEDGIKVFNAGTRYDFYCVKKCTKFQNTIVIDEKGNRLDLDLSDWDFLPNFNIDKISSLLGSGCDVMFSRSMYASDRAGISNTQDETFRYKLIHSTPKSGIRYMYADQDKGHFGVSKVIFGESGINDVIIDMDGEYGITNSSIGIEISNIDDANDLKYYLMNDFQEIIKGCMWGNFRIDWRLFTFFKKRFWE